MVYMSGDKNEKDTKNLLHDYIFSCYALRMW